MNSSLRKKVLEDIKEGVSEGESVDFAFITSTDGSRDCVTVQRMQNGEPLERLIKNIFTGIDFVASPEHHNAILLHKSGQYGSTNSLIADKKWSPPNIFSRPNIGISR